MNKTVFFLVALIVIAQCSTKRSFSYDGIIDSLVELNQVAGKDVNDIGVLSSKIQDAAKDTADRFTKFYENLSQRCQGGKALLEGYNKKIEGDKLEIQTRHDAAGDENTSIAEELVKLAGDANQQRSELEDLEKRIKAEIESIRTSAIEAERKIDIIKILRDIITDELLKEPSSPATSFVQLKTFSDKARELKVLLQNSNDSSMYTPLVSTLLSLAEKRGFSDSKILTQILDVLKKLDENLRSFREKQKTDGKKIIDTMREQVQQKLDQIKATAQIIAGKKSDQISNERIQKTTSTELEHISKEQERKVREIQNWDKICSNQDSVRKTTQIWQESFESKIKEVTAAIFTK